MKCFPGRSVVGLMLGGALVAGCGVTAGEQGQESSNVPQEQALQQPNVADPEEEGEPSQSPTEPVRTVGELLLPDDVIEAYSPSFAIEQAFGDIQAQSEFRS